MMPDRNDPEIRSAVAASGAQTFTAMAAEIFSRFGAARAWPVSLVKAVYSELNPPRAGLRSRYEHDMEVVDFISDRADLVHLSDLVRIGVTIVGRERFPSRSHLHRLVIKVRGWKPQTAEIAK
jgi:hypothetical protein